MQSSLVAIASKYGITDEEQRYEYDVARPKVEFLSTRFAKEVSGVWIFLHVACTNS